MCKTDKAREIDNLREYISLAKIFLRCGVTLLEYNYLIRNITEAENMLAALESRGELLIVRL